MKNDEILSRNFYILDTVGKKLIEILKNLENILFHLDPLNNYEKKEDAIFTNLTDKKNDIIIISNLIYNNITDINSIIHDFIKSIPPSYTYYSSFYHNEFLILKERKKNEPKYEKENILKRQEILDVTEKNSLNNEKIHDNYIYQNITTNSDDLINKNTETDESVINTISNLNSLKNDNCLLQTNETKPEEVEESLYFSFLIDLEYSNLLYMKKYEEKLKKYFIRIN